MRNKTKILVITLILIILLSIIIYGLIYFFNSNENKDNYVSRIIDGYTFELDSGEKEFD